MAFEEKLPLPHLFLSLVTLIAALGMHWEEVSRSKEVVSLKRFDLIGMKAYGYDQREKNVFHETRDFKMRVIDLAAGESIPQCDMASYVIFVGIDGEVKVEVDGDQVSLSRGQCLVTDPATISMKAFDGARLLGIQIAKGKTE